MLNNYYPSLEKVKELAQKGNLIPIYRTIRADLETPVSAYLKVARPPYSFLLESVEGGERISRFSFIGTVPGRVEQTRYGSVPIKLNLLILSPPSTLSSKNE
jgi:anthranilate synthase component 1